MKPSTEILKAIGVRLSNDYEKVLSDFPIGRPVVMNGINAVVIAHQEQDIFGSKCLFVTIRAVNGDGMTIDPYFWDLTYAGEPSQAQRGKGKKA
ncbi:MAG: hypothetical protein PHC53_02595 [Patescibacteria group bacterium]|nr:hypothetical protein [Patescibacteria group bacterium]